MGEGRLVVSLDEASLLAGACLTYAGVPFHRVEKSRTNAQELDRLDRLLERFVQAKKELRTVQESSPAGSSASKEIRLSETDLQLLVEVLAAVLQEHAPAGFHTDYALNLHVGPRSHVEAILNKLQSSQHQAQPA